MIGSRPSLSRTGQRAEPSESTSRATIVTSDANSPLHTPRASPTPRSSRHRPAELRGHPRGRHGLRRPRCPRPPLYPHAELGPDGSRRAALHRFLRPAVLWPRPRRAAHRHLPAAQQPDVQPHPARSHGNPSERNHHRRTPPRPRLRHGDARKVAPRRRSGIPPHPQRLRFLLRPALLQRHVAVPPQDRPPSGRRSADGVHPRADRVHRVRPVGRDLPAGLVPAAALDGERVGHRTQPPSGIAHGGLRGPGHRVHSREHRTAILRLYRARDAARAAVSGPLFPGPVVTRPVRRRDRGD